MEKAWRINAAPAWHMRALVRFFIFRVAYDQRRSYDYAEYPHLQELLTDVFKPAVVGGPATWKAHEPLTFGELLGSCRVSFFHSDPTTLLATQILEQATRGKLTTLYRLALCSSRSFARASLDSEAAKQYSSLSQRSQRVWARMRGMGIAHMPPPDSTREAFRCSV